MKNNYVFQTVHASEPAKQSAVGCFRVYRESRGENFIVRSSTASDSEAVEAFMFQALANDGGDVSILAQTDQRMVAFVEMRF